MTDQSSTAQKQVAVWPVTKVGHGVDLPRRADAPEGLFRASVCDPKTWGSKRLGFAVCACGWQGKAGWSRHYANLMARHHRGR